MRTGFVVGKFYPPHKGHKFLIETARARVDRMIVMIAHHPSQTIPGEVRRDWLAEIHPDCEIVLVDDNLEDDSQLWAKFTIECLGFVPDVVFSSEDYGPTFALLMGAQHVMVDRNRSAVPISATIIRKAPREYYDMLEPCVRAWFMPRVVLIGAESTGKTTLAARLASHYGTAWVPEYGREHWEKKVAGHAMTDPLPHWTREEFVHIAQEQHNREQQFARIAHDVLICDTNSFATGTWHLRYFGFRDSQVDALGAIAKSDLYLLTAPDVPFVQDGFRDGELIRSWMHNCFLQQLENGSIPWSILEGTYENRFVQATDAIDNIVRPRSTSN